MRNQFYVLIEIKNCDSSRHNIEIFESCHRDAVSEVNPDNGKGEICILIPEEIQNSILGSTKSHNLS